MSKEREGFDDRGKKMKREMDAYSERERRHMLDPAGGGTTLNTVTPCAACKLLRRRCAEECPFSPYFSPLVPQKFAAVHKVFGASNVSKLLLEVPENQRTDAANSLVYEANVRLSDPVYGCLGAISALQREVQYLQSELNAVRAEILKYKYRKAANNILPSTYASNLISSGSISVAGVQPPATPPPPPPRPPLPPPSVVVSTYSGPLATPTSMAASFSTIRNDKLPYFD